ncbi:Hypothetical_protein [Hexamita inflata]|uniref:Hypothetical_protein n=1 Tax=Hexamita inflata TaxID=28002 RepID=A0ABP1H1W2_9EUKA
MKLNNMNIISSCSFTGLRGNNLFQLSEDQLEPIVTVILTSYFQLLRQQLKAKKTIFSEIIWQSVFSQTVKFITFILKDNSVQFYTLTSKTGKEIHANQRKLFCQK